MIPETLDAPLWLPSEGQERFHLRGYKKPVIDDSIVERLDAIPVSCSKKQLALCIPQHQSKFAPTMREKGQPIMLIKRNDNFTITLAFEIVFRCQLLSIILMSIEFAIHNSVNLLIVIRERLVPIKREINDRESNMPET